MGSCQNYGPFLGPYYKIAPTIEGTQRGTILLTSTQIHVCYRLTDLEAVLVIEFQPARSATYGPPLEQKESGVNGITKKSMFYLEVF